jgi:hypothetical protein
MFGCLSAGDAFAHELDQSVGEEWVQGAVLDAQRLTI